MFCVKYVMADKTALPTLVLDEIDTGVSGDCHAAWKMMKAMAQKHQLITISHLPRSRQKVMSISWSIKIIPAGRHQ